MNKFYPNPGDIIVTHNGEKWICVTKEEYYRLIGVPSQWICEDKIFAVSEGFENNRSHMRWSEYDGVAECDQDFAIAKVIPKIPKAKPPEQNCDYAKIKTLELENQMLRTLLRKSGVDI